MQAFKMPKFVYEFNPWSTCQQTVVQRQFGGSGAVDQCVCMALTTISVFGSKNVTVKTLYKDRTFFKNKKLN